MDLIVFKNINRRLLGHFQEFPVVIKFVGEMIKADPSPKPCCNCVSQETMCSLLMWIILALTFLGLTTGFYFLSKLQSDAPDTHIRFSIVSVSVSELNPNASSSPEFHIVYQAKKAFQNSTDMCLYSKSTNISYHSINIASVVVAEIDYDYVPPYCYYNRPPYCSDYNYEPPACYNIENGSESVIPVLMSSSVPRYLRKQLWEDREIIMFDLEMDFITFWNWNWISYHVWCNNVALGAVHMQIQCNATMM